MSANELLSALKAVAEPTRLLMLELLLGWEGPRTGPVRSGERGLCLSDLELLVGLPHALVSHHLRILKEDGLSPASGAGGACGGVAPRRGNHPAASRRPEPLGRLSTAGRGRVGVSRGE